MGEDTLGNGNGQFGRPRIHTDDGIQIKYYDRPDKFLDKMAFSLTGDLGCEYGGRGTSVTAQGVTVSNDVNCHHDTATSHKQTFAEWMLYNRWWFDKDGPKNTNQDCSPGKGHRGGYTGSKNSIGTHG